MSTPVTFAAFEEPLVAQQALPRLGTGSHRVTIRSSSVRMTRKGAPFIVMSFANEGGEAYLSTTWLKLNGEPNPFARRILGELLFAIGRKTCAKPLALLSSSSAKIVGREVDITVARGEVTKLWVAGTAPRSRDLDEQEDQDEQVTAPRAKPAAVGAAAVLDGGDQG
jgi:hypothetical protein